MCHTLERPWADNEPYVSCFPEGLYRLVPFHSRKFGIDTFAFEGATVSVQPDPQYQRNLCIIHGANWVHQLQGCVAPGTEASILQDKLAVTRSQSALNTLLQAIYEEIENGVDTVKVGHVEAIMAG